MKMRTVAVVLGFFMGLAVAGSVVHAENRPAETPLLQALNGAVTRPMNSYIVDGGGLSLMALDAGPGCTTLQTGGVYEIHCNAPGHWCPWGDDGGVSCNSTIGSVSYGRPISVSTAMSPAPLYYVAPGNATIGATKSVCVAPAAGNTSIICAVFKLE